MTTDSFSDSLENGLGKGLRLDFGLSRGKKKTVSRKPDIHLVDCRPF